MGGIPSGTTVLKARPGQDGRQAAFAPPPIDEVVAAIKADKPDLVFAPHVETASGIMLPDAYLKKIADAIHAEGGLFVLDCLASGTRTEAHRVGQECSRQVRSRGCPQN